MNKKVQIVFTGVLLGASLLCYGVFFHSSVIFIPDDGKALESLKSEPAMMKLASIEGLKRDDSGKLTQTFGANEKAPKACPT